MELKIFKLFISDYLDFNKMLFNWNLDYANQKGRISVCAFFDKRGYQIKYNLRSKITRERVYTFVDPRKYNWRICFVSAGTSEEEVTKRRRSGRISKGGRYGNL